jgi:hypothetical protein
MRTVIKTPIFLSLLLSLLVVGLSVTPVVSSAAVAPSQSVSQGPGPTESNSKVKNLAGKVKKKLVSFGLKFDQSYPYVPTNHQMRYLNKKSRPPIDPKVKGVIDPLAQKVYIDARF